MTTCILWLHSVAMLAGYLGVLWLLATAVAKLALYTLDLIDRVLLRFAATRGLFLDVLDAADAKLKRGQK